MLTALACVWTLQAVARQGAEAVAVRLGSLLGRPQAQLDGFKSRVLRSETPAQRHLYATEWRSVDVAEGQHGPMLEIGGELGLDERMEHPLEQQCLQEPCGRAIQRQRP